MAIPPTSSAISAYNTTHFNRPLNPLLAVNLPLVLDRAPGQDAATEALRVALMGVGAVHQAYLLSRSSFTPSDQAGGIIGGMGALGLIPRVAGLRPVTTVTSVPPLADQGSPVASASSPASSDGGVGPLTTVVQLIPKGGGGIQNLSTHARDLLNVALGLRLAASRKLHEACQSMKGTLSDAALGASLTIALIDIFSGGHHWNGNITLAKTLVMLRGGPKALLSTPAAPNKFTGGAGEKVQPARLWLEILAVYETFGSLTSGEVPTLIGPGQNDWWFDTSGMSTYHRYSVEQVFGMSRSMIALVATVCAFLCRTIRERAILSPDCVPDIPIPTMDLGLGDLDPLIDDSALQDLDLSMLEPETDSNDGIDLNLLTATPPDDDFVVVEPLSNMLDSTLSPIDGGPLPPVTDLPIPEILTPQAQFIADARELYLTVYDYTALPSESPLPIPGLEARVRSGNETHRLAMCIILLRDVFRAPRLDERVQSFSRRILDICLTNTDAELGVDLTWPVIIGGSQVTGHDRQRVLETFDAYRLQCCFEIDSSEQIVTEVWRRVDASLPRADWRAVVEDLNLRILVL